MSTQYTRKVNNATVTETFVESLGYSRIRMRSLIEGLELAGKPIPNALTECLSHVVWLERVLREEPNAKTTTD